MHIRAFGVPVVVCCLLLVLSDRPAAAAQRGTAMTAMDYIEIQQLVNRLNFALDYCTNGGKDFADLFIDGGQFVIDNGEGKPTVRRTRDELISLAGGPDRSEERRVGKECRYRWATER